MFPRKRPDLSFDLVIEETKQKIPISVYLNPFIKDLLKLF